MHRTHFSMVRLQITVGLFKRNLTSGAGHGAEDGEGWIWLYSLCQNVNFHKHTGKTDLKMDSGNSL